MTFKPTHWAKVSVTVPFRCTSESHHRVYGSSTRRFAKQCNRSFHQLHLAFPHDTGYTGISHTASAPLYDMASADFSGTGSSPHGDLLIEARDSQVTGAHSGHTQSAADIAGFCPQYQLHKTLCSSRCRSGSPRLLKIMTIFLSNPKAPTWSFQEWEIKKPTKNLTPWASAINAFFVYQNLCLVAALNYPFINK